MQSGFRDTLKFLGLYIVGAIAALGWVFIGLYFYLRPITSTIFQPDFYQDIGTSLIAQGLIFFLTFTISGAIRIGQEDNDRKEAEKDRLMIREIHQWLQTQHKAPVDLISSNPEPANYNTSLPEEDSINQTKLQQMQ